MTVIDVHTHMLGRDWWELLRNHGGPQYSVGTGFDGRECVFSDGAQFLTTHPAHFDYALRIKAMDEAGVDVAIVSLTSPNAYFGDAEISTKAARLVNEEMAAAQRLYPDRIRWMASLPWEYPDHAVAELHRAHAAGAVGVMVIANIHERHLTEPAFAPIWAAIDALELPVLVHPTTPPGTAAQQLDEFMLASSVGFMYDTSLAISRMIFDGFFDRYRKLKIIASHAGGTLPYIAGRLDRIHEQLKAARVKIERRPSEYLREIWYDAIAYRIEALKLCIEIGGADRVMYGSDFPHTIGDMKGVLHRVDALDAATAKAIRQTNAERIFKL